MICNSNHSKRKRILFLSLLTLAIFVAAGLLLFPMLKMTLHLDFSQEYRKVEGVDKIRFLDNWSGKVYGRTFWGLRSVGYKKDEASGGYRESERDSGLSIERFSQHEVKQVEISPDGRYILYCEIEYGVNGGYSTDEDYCYYRVIDQENVEQYTIYSGYREWYQVYWETNY